MTPVLTSAGQAEPPAPEPDRDDRTVSRRSAEQADKVIESARFAPGSSDRTYEDRRRTRRLVGFSVLLPLWVLSVVPLARVSMEGRESTDAVLVYLAAGAITLGVAAVIRGVYASLARPRFWSPWLFLIAAVLALTGYLVQSAGEEIPVAAQALESRS